MEGPVERPGLFLLLGGIAEDAEEASGLSDTII
jgi:hypothetical protein